MSLAELSDAVPYWTEDMYSQRGGQDHLGLGSSVAIDRILPRL